MLEIVQQTIDFYTKYLKTPDIKELKIENPSLLNQKGSIFVTLYKNGEIRGSAGNIKEIKDTLAEELVENTIGALSKDERFSQVKLDEVPKLKIRVDLITGRKILQEGEIKSIDPTKNGIIAIQKNYNNMAVILPNINPLLLTGEDFLGVLKEKLHVKKIEEKELILYSIETQNINNF